MERLPSFLVTAVTLVMAVATAALGWTIPSLWSMAGDIGSLKARFDNFDKRFDAVDKQLDTISEKTTAISKRADGIDLRLSMRESDPTVLVAQAGLRPESEFGGVRVGEKLFVVPRNDKAAVELAGSGLKMEPITPSMFGYVLGTFDSGGKLQTGTVSTTTTAPPSPGGAFIQR